jgi:hypothetical protein
MGGWKVVSKLPLKGNDDLASSGVSCVRKIREMGCENKGSQLAAAAAAAAAASNPIAPLTACDSEIGDG